MYLKKVIVEYFQSYEKQEFNLVEGINVFVGTTDSGKSAVVRAIRWALYNTPRGFNFRSKFAKDKDVTRTSLLFGDIWIIRQRNNISGKNEINNYVIKEPGKKDQEFKALNLKVPEEVQKITKMLPINLQPQSEQYFLFGQGSSKVAKEFNAVAGLTIMDFVNQSINKKVRSANANIKTNADLLVETEYEIESYHWLDKSKKSFEILDSLDKKIKKDSVNLQNFKTVVLKISSAEEKLEKYWFAETAEEKLKELYSLQKCVKSSTVELNSIKKLCSSLEAHSKKLLELDYIKKAEENLKELVDISKSINCHIEKYDQLDKLVYKIDQINTKNKKFFNVAEAETALKKLVKLKTDTDTLTTTFNALNKLISSLDKIEKRIQKNNSELDEAETGFNAYKKELGVCPLCQSIL